MAGVFLMTQRSVWICKVLSINKRNLDTSQLCFFVCPSKPQKGQCHSATAKNWTASVIELKNTSEVCI